MKAFQQRHLKSVYFFFKKKTQNPPTNLLPFGPLGSILSRTTFFPLQSETSQVKAVFISPTFACFLMDVQKNVISFEK